MDQFDQAASEFYKQMEGFIPSDDYVGAHASQIVSMLREHYPTFNQDGREELHANLRKEGIPTDGSEQMWAGILRVMEESVVRQWAVKLDLGADVTKSHVNTAIQVQKNIRANLLLQARNLT